MGSHSQEDVGSNSQSSVLEFRVPLRASKNECLARDQNVLRNGLAFSQHEWQNEIQTTHLLSSIAQNSRFEQPEQEAAAAKQVHHESMLFRRQMEWDQHGSSSITAVPLGLPHDLTTFASEVSCGSQDVTQVCGTQQEVCGTQEVDPSTQEVCGTQEVVPSTQEVCRTQQADSDGSGTQESQNDANNDDDMMTLLTQRATRRLDEEDMYLECYVCFQDCADCTCTAFGAAQAWPPDET